MDGEFMTLDCDLSMNQAKQGECFNVHTRIVLHHLTVSFYGT
jgi:hypothetical protein